MPFDPNTARPMQPLAMTTAASPATPAVQMPKRPTFDPSTARAVLSPTPAADPVVRRPKRTWGEAATDAGASILQGASSFGTSLGQAANVVTGGALDKLVVRPASGALDRALGGPGTETTLAQGAEASREAIGGLKSASLQQSERELAQSEGVLPTAKKLLSDPKLLASQAFEQVPNVLGLAGLARAATTRGVAGALTRGAGSDVAAAAGATAGRRALIGASAAMGGGSAAEQAQLDALSLPDETWNANPEFQQLLARGVSRNDAKLQMAQTSGFKAAAIAAPLSAVAGRLTAGFEQRAFTGDLANAGISSLITRPGLRAGAGAVAREAGEEATQEAGEQFGQNVGVSGIDPSRQLSRGVPEAATIGGVLGGVIGGGIHVAGSAITRPRRAFEAPAADPAEDQSAAAPGSLTDAASAITRPSTPPAPPAPVAPSAPAAAAPTPVQADLLQPVQSSATTRSNGPVVPPVAVPWRGADGVIVATPDVEQVKAAMREQLAAQLAADKSLRISSTQLASVWGVATEVVKRARALVLKERAANPTDSSPAPSAQTQSDAAPRAPILLAPWVNSETGELTPPSVEDVRAAVLAQMASQRAEGLSTDVDSAAIASEWQVPERDVRMAWRAIEQVRDSTRRFGEPDPLDGVGAAPATPSAMPAGPISAAADLLPSVAAAPAPAATPSPNHGAALSRASDGMATPSAVGASAAAAPQNGPLEPVAAPPVALPEPPTISAPEEIPGGIAQPVPRAAGAAPASSMDDGGAAGAAAPSAAPGEPAGAPAAGGIGQPTPGVAPAAAAAPEAVGRLIKSRTPAGDDLVRFVDARGRAVTVRRRDLDNAQLPALATYNGDGVRNSGPRSAILRRDLRSLPNLAAVPENLRVTARAAPAAVAPTTPELAPQAAPIASGAPAGASDGAPVASEAPAVASEALAVAAERRVAIDQRAAVDALPVDEKDAEIARLRAVVEQMQGQIDTDPLTGVRSRAAYERDKSTAGGVAIIDIKLFKGYNTVGGQTGGDVVLRAVGEALRAAESADAIAHRSGGDEFAFLGASPDAVAEAVARFERTAAAIRVTIGRDGVHFHVDGVPFTSGIGNDEQSADADLGRRKGDYDRNALPESLRPVDPGELGAGDGAAELGGDDRERGVPRAEVERRADEPTAGAVAAQAHPNIETPPNGGVSVSGGNAAPAAAQDEVVAEPAPASDGAEIEAAAAEAATSPTNDRPEPTEAQKDAGNYKVGHIAINGLNVSIENPAGTSRRPEWPPLKNHYGYIRRTEGADGDHVDVFLGDRAQDVALPVFVIDQIDPKSGRFDEHKVILGAPTGREARAMYQSNYAKNWKGFGAITRMEWPAFKTWVLSDAVQKPANAELQQKTPAAPRLRGGIAPNGARVRVIDGKLQYVIGARETLEAYFKPGALVSGYGSTDKVVSFDWNDGRWSARVQKHGRRTTVDTRSDARWDVRDHQTMPPMRDVVRLLGPPQAPAKATSTKPATARPATDAAAAPFSQPSPVAAAGAALDENGVRGVVDEVTRTWGSNGPSVRVVATQEQLPASAKRDPGYKTANGFIDNDGRVYVIASALRTAHGVRTVLAHEAVGHYGINRMVDDAKVPGGWAKLTADIQRLRDEGLGSDRMKAVLRDVAKRYPNADAGTFARETLAVMAERGVQNGLIDRAVAAVRAFLRKIMPNVRFSEAELRQMLVRSDRYLRTGERYDERVARVGAMAFAQAPDADPSSIATPQFKRWFGDSKVVNENGEPLVVYHGTPSGAFATFDKSKASANFNPQLGDGFYFSPSKEYASHYATGEKGSVMSVYVSLKNPVDVASPRELKNLVFNERSSGSRYEQEQKASLKDSEILRSLGYDGIVLRHNGVVQELVAFRPEQIKSATGNSGAFDPTNPSMLFSQPGASIDTLDDVLTTPNAGVMARAKEWIAGKWQDAKPWFLGWITARHVLELMDPIVPAKHYADTMQRIAADRQALLEEYGALGTDASDWSRKNKAEAKRLSDLMNDATIAGSDPTKEYVPLQIRDSRGDFITATRQAVADRIKALRAQIRGRPGEVHVDKQEEIKQLQQALPREKARRAAYPGLVARFQQLSPKAQDLFVKFRDSYAAQSNRVEEALQARVKALDVPDNYKRQMAAQIRQQFEDQRLQGIYFPLSRNGDFWISASNKEGDQVFLMFENFADFRRGEKEVVRRGYKVDALGRRDSEYKAANAPSGTFVADAMETLRKAGVSETARDELYQLYLKTLPELSMRKHAIHRRKVAGYEVDHIRAYGKNMFHGSHQLARLRHAHVLQADLDAMKVAAANRRKEGMSPDEANRMDTLLAELQKRHDWIMSPKDSALANLASSVGFTYYLGLTPAAALINLTQGALTTFPVLGAKYGFDKAARMLGAATRDAVRTWGNVERVLQNDDERDALRTLRERGDIQRTAAHNLAGIAEGSEMQAHPAYARVMNGVSYLFSKMEEVNRQAAGLAAYRMARAAGDDHLAGIKYASEIINGTHFDFSNANRARHMQPALAKIALMFRQYALNMTWLLARNAYKAFKDESPEVRRLARRTLTGVLGMSALFSGAMGLPFMGVAGSVANALQAAFGDDDEPWDFNTEFRAFLAGFLGPEAARLVADGAVNRVGGDVANRVSLSQLWFRDADRELEGQDAYFHLLEQFAGPIGGLVKNLYVGKKQMDDGHLWRGVETLMPKAVKDAMKAFRFGDEGANTLRGDPVIEDVSIPEQFVQLLGFSPTRLSEQYRVNRAAKNYEQHYIDRRQDLLGALALAVRMQDDELRAAALEKIQAFNRAVPELALSPEAIRQSLRARARYSAQAEAGVVLNKRIAERVRAEVSTASSGG